MESVGRVTRSRARQTAGVTGTPLPDNAPSSAAPRSRKNAYEGTPVVALFKEARLTLDDVDQDTSSTVPAKSSIKQQKTPAKQAAAPAAAPAHSPPRQAVSVLSPTAAAAASVSSAHSSPQRSAGSAEGLAAEESEVGPGFGAFLPVDQGAFLVTEEDDDEAVVPAVTLSGSNACLDGQPLTLFPGSPTAAPAQQEVQASEPDFQASGFDTSMSPLPAARPAASSGAKRASMTVTGLPRASARLAATHTPQPSSARKVVVTPAATTTRAAKAAAQQQQQQVSTPQPAAPVPMLFTPAVTPAAGPSTADDDDDVLMASAPPTEVAATPVAFSLPPASDCQVTPVAEPAAAAPSAAAPAGCSEAEARALQDRAAAFTAAPKPADTPHPASGRTLGAVAPAFAVAAAAAAAAAIAAPAAAAAPAASAAAAAAAGPLAARSKRVSIATPQRIKPTSGAVSKAFARTTPHPKSGRTPAARPDEEEDAAEAEPTAGRTPKELADDLAGAADDHEVVEAEEGDDGSAAPLAPQAEEDLGLSMQQMVLGEMGQEEEEEEAAAAEGAVAAAALQAQADAAQAALAAQESVLMASPLRSKPAQTPVARSPQAPMSAARRVPPPPSPIAATFASSATPPPSRSTPSRYLQGTLSSSKKARAALPPTVFMAATGEPVSAMDSPVITPAADGGEEGHSPGRWAPEPSSQLKAGPTPGKATGYAAAAGGPSRAVKSKVEVPANSTVDPRSMKSYRREIKARSDKKAAAAVAAAKVVGLTEVRVNKLISKAAAAAPPPRAVAPPPGAEDSDDGQEEGTYDQVAEETLVAELNDGLKLDAHSAAPLRAAPLRGVPLPAGGHMRFADDGADGVNSPARTILRGVPLSQGQHKRWV